MCGFQHCLVHKAGLCNMQACQEQRRHLSTNLPLRCLLPLQANLRTYAYCHFYAQLNMQPLQMVAATAPL